MSAADLARTTALNPTGVRKSLEQLIDAGILESVGAGSRWLVRMRQDHPLTPDLRRLFLAESSRLPMLRKAVAGVADSLPTPPLSLWLQGPVTVGADEPGDALTIGVLAGGTDIDSTVETLRERLAAIQRKMDVTLEVNGFSKADFATLSVAEREEIERASLLWGPHPAGFLQTTQVRKARQTKRTHQSLDSRSLALARAVAQKLRTDPSLVERARHRIAARLRMASPGERKELKEWDQVLRSGSPTRLRRLLADTGSRATRLRQTLPFLDTLTREEREKIFAASEEE